MGRKPKEEGPGITLLEAIETLSDIAQLEVDNNISIAETGEVVIGQRNIIEWLNLQDEEETVENIRGIFSLILKYIQSVYSEREPQHSEEVIEGIKTIMVLVGEAAKNLDKYTNLFRWTHENSITELAEYRNLQEFYQNRIAQKVDTRQLSRWIFGLAQQMPESSDVQLQGRVKSKAEHVYVDLEAVKKDTEYELFSLRKEDGSRFFSPQLVRNMTLVSDFGSRIGSGVEVHEPAIPVRHWQDWRMRGSAKSIRESVGPMLERFYRETNSHKNHELVNHLQHAMMALMLSCNSANDLAEDVHRKSTFDYFADFIYFLRASLCTREYQKMVAYPPNRQNKLAYAQLDLINGLCYALFLQMKGEQYLLKALHEALDQAEEMLSEEHIECRDESNEVWNWLACDYKALSALMQQHSNGPLEKILSDLQEGGNQFFDPIWQHDLPCQLFSIYVQEQRITNIRMPCPIHQEVVNKAFINEEFKAFLRALKESPISHRHLIINFQDRTSWREHARCSAIEDLQNVSDFHDHLAVVTLSKDSDFYNQNDLYAAENHAAVFTANFLDHLTDESCGYFYPEWIKEQLTTEFLHGVIDEVHRIFFNEKNVLSKEQRCDLIEIVYCFLELKLIEVAKAETFSLVCKDGIDVSACANVLLYVLLKIMNQEDLSDNDKSHLRMILYAPALLIRERAVVGSRFNRMVSALRRIEALRSEFGAVNFGKIMHEAFGKFYETPILDGMTIPIQPH